jgi:hypothetical protein
MSKLISGELLQADDIVFGSYGVHGRVEIQWLVNTPVVAGVEKEYHLLDEIRVVSLQCNHSLESRLSEGKGM